MGKQDMQTPHVHSDNRSIATWSLLMVSAGCFLSTIGAEPEIGGGPLAMVSLGALDPFRVWSGELWRFVTALFIYDGFLDFAISAFVLLQLGRSLEYLIGPSRLIFLVLITGAGGFATSLLVNMSITAGISGALFGIAGALMVLLYALPRATEQTRFLKGLTLIVALNLGLGFFTNVALAGQSSLFVDNAAHAAGLVLGMLLGLGFLPDTQKHFLGFKAPKAGSWPAFALATAMMLFMVAVTAAVQPSFSPQYHFSMGTLALQAKDLQRAREHKQMLAAASGSNSAELALLNARIAAYEGHDAAHIKYLRDALTLVPDASSLLDTSMASFGGLMSKEEALFADERGHGFLCDKIARQDGSTGNQNRLLNDCAWLFLYAKDKRVNNAAKGLNLAKAAVKADNKMSIDTLHTLAEAYAASKDYQEAVATMQRAELLGPRFAAQKKLEVDRQRMEHLAMKADSEFTATH